MSVILSLDTSDWDSKSPLFRPSLERAQSRMTEDGSAIIEEEMRDSVPVRTGKLRSSVRRHSMTSTGAIISTSSGYGRYVDEGVGPRIIRGNPILRFPMDGHTIFARQVFNPGFAGRHFKEKTLNRSRPRIEEMTRRVMDEEFGR